MKTKTQTITIPKQQMQIINEILTMTGDKIYDKYGYKRDEVISYTAKFDDDDGISIEADIKLVICDGCETPYTEGVLFENGHECTHTEVDETYEGEWIFEYKDTQYIVNVTVEQDEEPNRQKEQAESKKAHMTVRNAKTEIQKTKTAIDVLCEIRPDEMSDIMKRLNSLDWGETDNATHTDLTWGDVKTCAITAMKMRINILERKIDNAVI